MTPEQIWLTLAQLIVERYLVRVYLVRQQP